MKMMMITIERIIAFVMQAMAEDFIVDVTDAGIDVYNTKNGNACCAFYITNSSVMIRTNKGKIVIDIKEEDYHKLVVLKDQIKKYREDKAIEEFNNFFKEDKKLTDINDLNDEEE